jgi:signal transduction histidine kinase
MPQMPQMSSSVLRQRRLSLGTLLIGLNAGLVLLAVVGVAVSALGLIERFADSQGLARVDLAGAAAQEAVARSARDVRTSAHLLAERPTVKRLVEGGDAAGLAAFLERFRRTSALSGVAIVTGGARGARTTAGPALPWDAVLPRSAEEGPAAILRRPDGSLFLAAAAPLAATPDATAAAALALDPALARQIAGQVGLPVALLAPEPALADLNDPRRPLRAAVLADGKAVSGRLKDAGLYLSVRPLRGPTGEVAALVETALPRAGVAASLARLSRRLLLLSLLVAALATLSGFLISRRLARPVAELTRAAARIGRGDLSTATPHAPGAELGTLAATMEEMRRRLLGLTSELRRRQAEGEAILTGIVEGVFSVDRDRRIRYLNPQAAALLGVTPEGALGRFCGDVLNPQGPRGKESLRPCDESCPIVHARFRGGATAAERLLRPDGTRRTVVITSAPPTEERQFQVLRDETALEGARRQRDAVLANISHEFRTPLSAQLASIELLRERLLHDPHGVDPASHALVQALERGSLRLTQLIDNLLESVRIESGQDSIRGGAVALDEVAEEAVEMTAPLLAQRGQAVEVDLPFPLPAVRGDAPRLTQVLVNLLANANKFAPAGSRVRIGGEAEASRVLLWVEDEGPGMPGGAGGAAALFEPFVRRAGDGGEGEDRSEPEPAGMGLGLWIVRSIVERHGGTLEALPGSGGRGTRMRIGLPLAAAAAVEGKAGEAA